MKQNIVAIILARGGSKTLQGKNIRLLAHKPLIAYTIGQAKKCKLINRVIVSTDDPEIAEVAKKFGAEVPFSRPKELAQNHSTTESGLQHAVKWIEANENYRIDIVVFLQITDVFRSQWMINAVINKLLEDENLDSVFIATKTHKNFWRKVNEKWIKLAADIPYASRHIREPLYREDTGLACATRAKFIKQGRRLGDRVEIIVNKEEEYSSIDIHTAFDFWLAEKVITEWGVKPNGP